MGGYQSKNSIWVSNKIYELFVNVKKKSISLIVIIMCKERKFEMLSWRREMKYVIFVDDLDFVYKCSDKIIFSIMMYDGKMIN